jgi:predicted AlkP superfamily pyrophosphatase or phosphodiesterase
MKADKRCLVVWFVLTSIFWPLAGRGQEAAPATASDAVSADDVRLILLLVVDQLGAEQLERIAPLLTGGLHRLLDEGVSFSEAQHAHALTETAPGHATLASGRHPRHHGIVSNSWVEPGGRKKTYSVDDAEHDESPRSLRTSTLGDWVKESNADSKVFAASRKDRAAILLGGRGADGAFWYDDETGYFETSGYYGEPPPGWLLEFNARNLIDAYYGKAWEPLPLDQEALREAAIEPMDFGILRSGFPHLYGALQPAPSESFYYHLIDSPWLDDYLVQFAKHLIAAEGLGGDSATDVLGLSFSALDSVGHDYGPDSREYLDVVLRLDRGLDALLEFIDERVGLQRVVIGFSADHGVVQLPEIRQRRGLAGARVGPEDLACVQGVGSRMAERYGVEPWLLPGSYLNPAAVEQKDRPRRGLELETARLLEQCPAVERVWVRSDLEAAQAEQGSEQWLFANSFFPQRSPDFLIRFQEQFVPSVSLTTTHGSSYRYDTWVPLVFWADGLEAAVVDTPVRSVDFAPTLAALAGITAPSDLDGVVRLERPRP